MDLELYKCSLCNGLKGEKCDDYGCSTQWHDCWKCKGTGKIPSEEIQKLIELVIKYGSKR